MSRTHGSYAVAAALFLAASAMSAQQSYPQTLYWGSGLVDIPVAWVSPLSGDFGLGFSSKTIKGSQISSGFGKGMNTNLAMSASLWGRAELGWSLYSDDPEWGFFGRALLINEEDYRLKGGAAAWIPSLAVGMRNVGPYSKVDRFGLGYHLGLPTSQDPNREHVVDSLHQNFSTAETVYGVATKSFNLSDVNRNWPNVGLSFTLGYGNGLFKNDGGLGSAYARHSTGGVFGGAKVEFYPSSRSAVSLMFENNAWDYNLGAVLNYRGILAGVYWTEMGAGSAGSSPATPYNYDKFALTLGWQNNVLALLRGNFLQERVTQLEKERASLLAEMGNRQKRIASLQLEIDRYKAQSLLELETRRAQAEQELKAEREALQRLQERLRRLEQTIPPAEQKPPR